MAIPFRRPFQQRRLHEQKLSREKDLQKLTGRKVSSREVLDEWRGE